MYDVIFASAGALMVTAGVLVLSLPSECETIPARLNMKCTKNGKKHLNILMIYFIKSIHKPKKTGLRLPCFLPIRLNKLS